MTKTITLATAQELAKRFTDLPKSQRVWFLGLQNKWSVRHREDAQQAVNNTPRYPAYTWEEILITHAKYFFGEVVDEAEVWGFCSDCGCNWKISSLIKLLQQGKDEEAEAYFLNSLISKK
jgi:hypothetical protein